MNFDLDHKIIKDFYFKSYKYRDIILFAVVRLPKIFKRVEAPTLGVWLSKGKLTISLR